LANLFNLTLNPNQSNIKSNTRTQQGRHLRGWGDRPTTSESWPPYF